MRARIVLTAGLTLVALVGEGCRREPAAAVLRPARLQVGGTLVLDPAFSPDGKLVAYSSDKSGTFEIYVRPVAGEGAEVQLTNDRSQNFEPAFSPDGRTVAYHSKGRGGLWAVGLEGGRPRVLSDFGSSPAFSPDGEEIAFQSQPRDDLGATAPPAVPPSAIWKVPARGGVARDLTREGKPVGGHGLPFWSHDGSHVYFVVTDSKLSWAELWRVQASGGEPERLLTQKVIYGCVLDQDERIIFSGLDPSGEHAILETRLAERGAPSVRVLGSAATPRGVPRRLALSRDGRQLAWAIVSTSGNLVSLPLDRNTWLPAGPPRPLTSGAGTRHTWPVFSPDGSRLAYGADGASLTAQVWVMDAGGGSPRQVTSSPDGAFVQDWFPDGRRLFVLGKRGGSTPLTALSLEDGLETPFPLAAPDIAVPRLSPDGKRVAYNSKKGSPTINVWVTDVGSGAVRQLTQDREFFGFACWSPDSRLLAAQVKRGGDMQVAVVPAEGGRPEQLTDGPGLSWCFSWTPDGSRVVFAGLRRGFWNVYWVARATREVRALTSYSKLNAYVRYPAVSPRGDQVVYEYAESTGELFTMALR